MQLFLNLHQKSQQVIKMGELKVKWVKIILSMIFSFEMRLHDQILVILFYFCLPLIPIYLLVGPTLY